MTTNLTRGIWAARCLTLALALTGATALPTAAQTIYGLYTDVAAMSAFPSKLVAFQASNPNTFTSIVNITGQRTDLTLVGLDVRPATGELFALGYTPNSIQAQLYKLNPATGVATAVGSGFPLNLGAYNTQIGFDFNPITDRIRVTCGNRTNWSLNPNTGTEESYDGMLTYASTDVNAAQLPRIGASAYGNSYAGATTTTLYDIDEAYNRLVTQSLTSSGTLNTVAALSGAAVPVNGISDIDIYYNPSTGTNTAYFTTAASLGGQLSSPTTAAFYTLDLTTGVATQLGAPVTPGSIGWLSDIAVSAPSVVTGTRTAELAANFALYPNPVANTTRITFEQPHAAHVELLVTDALGRTVDKLDAGQRPAGAQTIDWNRQGQAVGLYFFHLSFAGQPAGVRQVMLTQ